MDDQRSNKGASTEGRERHELLLALNAAHVSRSAICRLALDLDAWWFAGRRRAVTSIALQLGLQPKAVEAARAVARESRDPVRREEERAARAGARILTVLDSDYPPALHDLALPPPVLYLRGTLPSAPGIALVGSRRPDVYGREVATLFGRELARAGAVVFSGFARGVDAAAHRGALDAPGGTTVAVLGCGLEADYPRGQRKLAEQITERGALLSELPMGQGPRAQHFPVRNRIIAALAQVTLVVRATARSGSLITARQALELGRDVAAVPGRIFADLSEGPNSLLRLGALAVQHPRQLLELLQPPLPSEANREAPKPVAAGRAQPGSEEGDAKKVGQRLLSALHHGETVAAERLADDCGLALDTALAELLELELGGWIRKEPGGRYSRRL